MTTSSNENDTQRLIEEARREGRWEERWKQIEAGRRRSKRLIEELDYLAELMRRERRWRWR